MTRPINGNLGGLAYRAIQRLRREPVVEALRELEESQRWPREKLITLQWQRVRAMIERAYQDPFYKKRMDSVGLTPRDVHGPKEFALIPPLTKFDLQQHAVALRATRQEGPVSSMATSGSSGYPLSIWRSRRSTAYARAAMYRAHRWHGLAIGDRELRLWGEPVAWKSKFHELFKDRLMNRFRFSAFDMRTESLRRFYEEIKRRKPVYLFGYATLLDHFTRVAVAEKWELASLGLQCIKTTSEPLSPGQSERMSRAFGCSVLNEYGCTEAGVIAASCLAGGLHTSPETVYLELVPVAGSPWCRVLVTDLHNRAMPLLRYEVGDMAEPAANERCACGLELPLLGRVLGREGEIIEVSGGRRVHSLVLYYTFMELINQGTSVRQARLVQNSPEKFVCQIVSETSPSRQEVQLILGSLTKHFGDGVRIDVERVPDIPRLPSGKHSDFVKAFS